MQCLDRRRELPFKCTCRNQSRKNSARALSLVIVRRLYTSCAVSAPLGRTSRHKVPWPTSPVHGTGTPHKEVERSGEAGAPTRTLPESDHTPNVAPNAATVVSYHRHVRHANTHTDTHFNHKDSSHTKKISKSYTTQMQRTVLTWLTRCCGSVRAKLFDDSKAVSERVGCATNLQSSLRGHGPGSNRDTWPHSSRSSSRACHWDDKTRLEPTTGHGPSGANRSVSPLHQATLTLTHRICLSSRWTRPG